MDFDAVYPLYRREIQRASRRAFVYGLDADDIASEMTICLWKATLTYDECKTDTPFGAYWWSVWKNRRSDLLERYFAQKRIHPDLIPHGHSTLDQIEVVERQVPPPPGVTAEGAFVWALLAEGSPGVEARSLAEVTKRTYYAQIQAWRTQKVRDWILKV